MKKLIPLLLLCGPALAAPTYTYTEASDTTAAVNLVLTKPASVVSGSKCVIVVWFENNAGTGYAEPDQVDDWTLLTLIEDSDDLENMQIFTRTMDGTEGATETLVDLAAVLETTGFYVCVHGSDSGEFFNGTVGANYVSAGNASSHAVTAGTTSVNDALAIGFFGFDGADGSPFGSFATGWSQVDSIAANAGSATSVEQTFATKTIASAGTTGTMTVTSAVSDNAVGKILTFAPAAAGSAVPLIQNHQQRSRL